MRKITPRIRFLLLSIVAVLVFGSVPGLNVSTRAQPVCDTEFYNKNDIPFFNPCIESCGSGSFPIATSTIKIRGEGNAEKTYNFLVDAGLTDQQAAVTAASLYHRSGLSAFRQQAGVEWEQGGWGIAQFSGEQRTTLKSFLARNVGSATFATYYDEVYGGVVTESTGFVPDGVPIEINDDFLIEELRFFFDYIDTLLVDDALVTSVYGETDEVYDRTSTFLTNLKSLEQIDDIARVWTRLYNPPESPDTVISSVSNTAREFLQQYSKGTSSNCGGNLVAGGMDLQTAIDFVEKYKTSPDSINFIGGAGQGCNGGALSNCVSFSVYFINKYTTFVGFGADRTAGPGNGSTVAPNAIARNPSIESGNSPRPYAIFSTPSGSDECPKGSGVKCGHTGVILGVDTAREVVIVGEAGCSSALSWDTAREYPLSRFDSPAYTYAYTDGFLKENVE